MIFEFILRDLANRCLAVEQVAFSQTELESKTPNWRFIKSLPPFCLYFKQKKSYCNPWSEYSSVRGSMRMKNKMRIKNLRWVQYIPADCALMHPSWFRMAVSHFVCRRFSNLNVWLGIVSGVGCMRNSRRVWSLNAEVARKISNTNTSATSRLSTGFLSLYVSL